MDQESANGHLPRITTAPGALSLEVLSSLENRSTVENGQIVTALSSQKSSRLVAKNGTCLLTAVDLPHAFKNRLSNWFHLIIEYPWRTILAIFGGGLVFTWLFFAVVYLVIAWAAGDLDRDRHDQSDYEPCLQNVHSFITALLFSVETQESIGYGYRFVTGACPPAYIAVFAQVIVGILIQNALCAIVIAKLLRPKKRVRELRFSKTAVVAPVWTAIDDDETTQNFLLPAAENNNHRMALMFRVADIEQKLNTPEAHVRLYMAKTRINKKGLREVLYTRDLNVGFSNGWDRLLLLWPVLIVHVIDETSPLYGITADSLRSAVDFELIVTVEGAVEATGMTFQARTSYLPQEIQWGRRFLPITRLNEHSNRFNIQYSFFDHTVPADMTTSEPRTNEDERNREEQEGSENVEQIKGKEINYSGFY